MITGEDGQPIKTDEKPQADANQDTAIDKPIIGIDKVGNLTMVIPLHKTDEVFARGIVDYCRSQVLSWYAERNRQRAQTAQLAAKTGFQRFRDKLLRR